MSIRKKAILALLLMALVFGLMWLIHAYLKFHEGMKGPWKFNPRW